MINNRSDFERGSTNTLNKMTENKFKSRLTMLLSVLKLHRRRSLVKIKWPEDIFKGTQQMPGNSRRNYQFIIQTETRRP